MTLGTAVIPLPDDAIFVAKTLELFAHNAFRHRTIRAPLHVANTSTAFERLVLGRHFDDACQRVCSPLA